MVIIESYCIKNEFLTISVNRFGAELKSIILNKTGKEYLWQADPAYWKRTSPILFPIVGSLKEKKYRYKDIDYPMRQHGFARDMDFVLTKETENSLSFILEDTSETKKEYPFHFKLFIDYTLLEKSVLVHWKVINTNEKTIYFSIGSHPAFSCPLSDHEKQADCFLSFDTEGPLRYSLINEKGLYVKNNYTMKLENHNFPLHEHLFDQDALIFENYQIKKVQLLHPDKTPYLSIQFHAPLVGIWSSPKKNAPFVCIEPWYGRCDAQDFVGNLQEREWGNSLVGGAAFSASYKIEICE